MLVLCHKGSVISKHELMYLNISGLSCKLKVADIEQFYPQSALYPYSLSGIGEGIRITIERKIENHAERRTQHCFTLLPTHNGSGSSPLKLTDTCMQGRYQLDKVVRAP